MQVNYVEPLLSSAIVSDAAFCTMLRLARCTAPPLCNWAPEIAAAIRVISVGDFEMVLDLTPVIMEDDSKKKPSSGLFEQIVNGLTIACKAGPLPADSFTFVFPVCRPLSLVQPQIHFYFSFPFNIYFSLFLSFCLFMSLPFGSDHGKDPSIFKKDMSS